MDAIEKETPNMKLARVIERSDGPRIEGTRITVYTILEYLRAGHSRDYIAAMLFLSSAQVQAAIDYIHEHEADVNAVLDEIMERIGKGNPPEVLAKLEASHKKLEAMRARFEADGRLAPRMGSAESNGSNAMPARIVQRSGEPRIEGTRISVYTVLEYLRAGRSRDYIAGTFLLSPAQVQAAIDYISEHEEEVNAEFEQMMAKVRQGNPPEVRAIMESGRKNLDALRARFKAEGQLR